MLIFIDVVSKGQTELNQLEAWPENTCKMTLVSFRRSIWLIVDETS